jgi:hypothetical protein
MIPFFPKIMLELGLQLLLQLIVSVIPIENCLLIHFSQDFPQESTVPSLTVINKRLLSGQARSSNIFIATNLLVISILIENITSIMKQLR